MADNQFQERTEQATPKRLEDARRKGQIPRSRELNMAVVMFTGAGMLWYGQAGLGQMVRDLMAQSLQLDPATLEHPEFMATALGQASIAALTTLLPLLLALSAAAVGGAILVGGWMFTPEPVSPKFERLDPLKGLARMFSLNSLVEVLKAVAKAICIAIVAIAFLWSSAGDVLRLGQEAVPDAIGHGMHLSIVTLAICSAVVLVIGAADAPYQLWNHARQLRMTRQEVLDELKESEGRPEVRSRIRALQQEVARRRMLADVPTADVVVTNPTHFAVALRYDDKRNRAPVVVARGTDHLAARIRSIAAENKVALFEAPLLARALYWTTDVGREIPGVLYVAVAQVLTYVYRLRHASTQGGAAPERPQVNVDPQLAEKPRRGRPAT
jgi:flagellar biosynthesis protein FlhB